MPASITSHNGALVRDKYLFPRRQSEVARLDLQHYALREHLGTNHLAPVGEMGSLLDVGCGTGQWAAEMAAAFDGACSVGLDLVVPPAGPPNGVRFVRGNLLQGLPFGDGTFDLVHERLLVTSVPVEEWLPLVQELVRVARPGGWVELVEPMMTFDHAGPATTRLSDLMLRLAAPRGLDTTSVVYRILDGYLHRAGLERVERRTFSVPIGAWAGSVGSFQRSNFRSGFQRICEVAPPSIGFADDEARDLVEEALAECERNHITWTFAATFGRRPG
jgi:SAM-dependent methyltransferase